MEGNLHEYTFCHFFFNLFKNTRDTPWDDASIELIFSSYHGKSFASASLAVAKYAYLIANHRIINQGLNFFKYYLLSIIFLENSIETKGCSILR